MRLRDPFVLGALLLLSACPEDPQPAESASESAATLVTTTAGSTSTPADTTDSASSGDAEPTGPSSGCVTDSATTTT